MHPTRAQLLQHGHNTLRCAQVCCALCVWAESSVFPPPTHADLTDEHPFASAVDIWLPYLFKHTVERVFKMEMMLKLPNTGSALWQQ